MKKYLLSFLVIGTLAILASCGGDEPKTTPGSGTGSSSTGGSGSTSGGSSSGSGAKKIKSISKSYTLKIGADMLSTSVVEVSYIDEKGEKKTETVSAKEWKKSVAVADLKKTEIGMSVRFKPGSRATINNNSYYDIDVQECIEYVVVYEDNTTSKLPVINIQPLTEDVKGQYLDPALNAVSIAATNSLNIDVSNLDLKRTNFFVSNGTINGLPISNQVAPTEGNAKVYLQEEEFIDLDLPSHTLWANRNVGAKTPYETGGLYGWGDATGYQTSTNPYYYYTSSPTIMDIQATRYDLANNVNRQWMLPTRDQMAELYEFTTQSSPTIEQGVKGIWFTSKRNGKKMFLPMNNYRNGATNFVSETRYWTSTLCSNDKSHAWTMWMSGMGNIYHPGYSDGTKAPMSNSSLDRYYGCCIRAVKNPKYTIVIN